MAFDPNTYSAATTFGELGAAYEQAFNRVPAQVRSVEWAIKQVPSGAKVLDVGCGTGKPACEMFVQAGLDTTGIDITPEMIEIAKKNVPGGKYEVMDSRTWQPPNGVKYDGIVSYFAFIAGVSQADIKQYFKTAHGWLKPGGTFVFGTVPVVGENQTIKWLGKDAVVSGLSVEGNLEAIKDAGFAVEQNFVETFKPTAAEAGICKEDDVWPEDHLFVHCKKQN